jgi:ribosomal protein L2
MVMTPFCSMPEFDSAENSGRNSQGKINHALYGCGQVRDIVSLISKEQRKEIPTVKSTEYDPNRTYLSHC